MGGGGGAETMLGSPSFTRPPPPGSASAASASATGDAETPAALGLFLGYFDWRVFQDGWVGEGGVCSFPPSSHPTL